MARVVNIYRYKTTNIGDRYSSPSLYFDWLRDADTTDIWTENIGKSINDIRKKVLILGGGGLIANHDFEKSVAWLSNAPFVKKVIWGAGHNTHGTDRIEKVSRYINKFDLVGIRDIGTKYTWVPCVSCMHKLFDIEYATKHEIVVYEHRSFPLDINIYPKHNNRSDNLEEVLAFLGSGETIITNSYHGAYWATLLRRKVILIDPFSSKFSRMNYSPIISTSHEYKKYLKDTRIYPNALEECRKINIDFAESVKRMVFS